MRFEVLGRSYSAVVEGNSVRLSFPAPLVADLDDRILKDPDLNLLRNQELPS